MKNKTLEEITVFCSEKAPHWKYDEEKIQRKFTFPSFEAALDFVNAIAILAEKHHHHPEILIQFNEVVLQLSTNDSNGITQKDFDLIKEIDTLRKN